MAFREPLPDDVTHRALRERITPRPTDPHFLHLHSLRDALSEIFTEIAAETEPERLLDIFCGTTPYRAIMPAGQLVTVDIDFHFGHPNVVAGIDQPFRDGSFDVVVCTQTIYLLPEARRLEREMYRVLRPGGMAVVSVPIMFRGETAGYEHRYTPSEFAGLFSAWDEVALVRAGGIGTGGAYWANAWLRGLARRLAIPAAIQGYAYRLVNALGGGVDHIVGDRGTPATVIVSARRPSD